MEENITKWNGFPGVFQSEGQPLATCNLNPGEHVYGKNWLK